MALQTVSRGKCLVAPIGNRLGSSGALQDSSAMIAVSDSGIAFWNVAMSDPRHKDNLPGMSGDFDRFAVNAKLFYVVFGSNAKNSLTYTTITIEAYLQNLNGAATILWYKDGCYDGLSVTTQGEITLSVTLDGGSQYPAPSYTTKKRKKYCRVAAVASSTGGDPKQTTPFAFQTPDDVLTELKYGLNEIMKFEDWKKVDPETLYIVLAPEWYFRKKRSTTKADLDELDLSAMGFWTMKEMTEICEGLKAMSEVCEGWLIVPGTILWAMPTTVNGKKVAQVYNTTQIVEGGEVVHTYHKQYYGNEFDAMRDDQIFGLQPNADNKVVFSDEEKKFWDDWIKHLSVQPSNSNLKQLVQGSFEYEGVKFGIEVCADHMRGGNEGKLRQERIKEMGGTDYGKDLDRDIHILLSNGAYMRAPNVTLRKGGLFLNSDGQSRIDRNLQLSRGLAVSECAGTDLDTDMFGKILPYYVCIMEPTSTEYNKTGNTNYVKESGGKGQRFVVAIKKRFSLPLT